MFKKVYKNILDTLFLIHCVSCDTEGQWLCEICQRKILFQTEHVCGVCEKVITPDGLTCLNCKKKNNIDGLLVACSYEQKLVAKLIHLFKYRFIDDLSSTLGNFLIKSLQQTELALPNLIIPVPLHPKRLHWRGFNQSELLAKHLAQNLLTATPLELSTETLIRHRHTSSQKEISDHKARLENIKNAFSVTSTDEIRNKIILLVDDVATTGSTIFECAKTLKQAGAKQVFAIVIARQNNSK
jgi:ComF family protein